LPEAFPQEPARSHTIQISLILDTKNLFRALFESVVVNGPALLVVAAVGDRDGRRAAAGHEGGGRHGRGAAAAHEQHLARLGAARQHRRLLGAAGHEVAGGVRLQRPPSLGELGRRARQRRLARGTHQTAAVVTLEFVRARFAVDEALGTRREVVARELGHGAHVDGVRVVAASATTKIMDFF